MGTAIVGVLAVLGLAGSALLFMAVVGLLGPVQEALTGEHPQARVDAYLRAVAEGREDDALLGWHVATGASGDARDRALDERRAAVTRRLVEAGARPDGAAPDLEWWGTCCEPHVVGDQRLAGLARVRVRLVQRDGAAVAYTLDVRTAEPYPAAGPSFPARRWLLVDVYPSVEDPLAFGWVRGPQGARPIRPSGLIVGGR